MSRRFKTMTPNPPPDYKEIARQDWTGAAPFWKKWNAKLAAQSGAATELVVVGAELAPGLHVLDLASGTGEPALSVARAVGARGRVVATDLVPEMLAAARENAQAQGLSQIEFRLADAESLPFAAAEFDRVTCRFGVMFFPDIAKALAEIRRVLKPAGRISFLVWGSLEENPLFLTTLGPVLKRLAVPPPPPDAPGVFRFADPTRLADTLTAAGFHHVHAAKHQVVWPWPGPAEEAWQALSELAGPFRKMIAALDPQQTTEVVREVMAGVRRFHDGKTVNFPATLVSATAAV